MTDYGREFSIIHRYSRMYMSRITEKYGLPGRIMPYIRVISTCPGLSQDALAREFMIDKGSVARTIAMLVDKGLVERKANERNKRENLIYPTEDMKRIYREGCQCCEELNMIVGRGLSEEETAVFLEVLTKIADNLINALGKEKCDDKTAQLP